MYGRIGFRVILAGGLLGLAACAELDLALEGGSAVPEAPRAPLEQSQTLPTGAAQTVESLDQSSAAERVAATRAGGSGRALGQTVASLGSPAEPGFWLKTPLVSAEASGRVRDARTGKSVAVTLIPIEGPPTAGSRLSLSAMRALEVGLTDLVTVDVTG